MSQQTILIAIIALCFLGIWLLSVRFRRFIYWLVIGRPDLRIDELPGNLNEALDELEKDDLMREMLGEHLFEHFVAAKREEWLDYIKHVSPWEVERYLEMY